MVKTKIINKRILRVENEDDRKKFLIYFFSSTALFALIIFGIRGIINGNVLYSISIFSFFLVTLMNLVFLKIKKKISIAAHIMLVLMFLLELELFCSLGEEMSALFWYYVFPPLAITLFDNKRGTVYSILLIVVTLVLLLIKPGFLTNIYSTEIIYKFVFIYIVISILINIFEYSRKVTYQAYLSKLDIIKEKNNDLVSAKEELKQYNEQLYFAKEKAEENEIQLKELNATKDKLFSIIAHDLRSPFNSILGYSSLLINEKNEKRSEEHLKSLNIINSSANNTLVLLDNLLSWAKSQSGQIILIPEKIVLASIINEVLEFVNSTAKFKKISLNHDPSGEIEVFTDQNILKTVLRNLISNSIKFTKPGGNINVFAISKQKKVEITVSDDGVGMNNETKNKLFKFDTNYTSVGTENEKGSGLGLVLCKEFVEKLGGEIWLESEEGVGSDFKFTLPLNKPTNL